jgi:prolyl oligopeptidase
MLMKTLYSFCLVLPLLSVSPTQAADLRVGIIGCDTSHVTAFTETLNNPQAKGHIPGCKVVAAYKGGSADIPSSATRVEGFRRTLQEKYGVHFYDTIEELCANVDAVLLESVDGRPHLEQAKPVLQARKTLFIDKPMAGSLRDVIEIFRLAKEANVPVFSSSALRFGKDTQQVAHGSLGKVNYAETFGPCELEPHHPDLFWYGVHGVEALFTVLGTGCQTVQRGTNDGKIEVTGLWTGGRKGVFREDPKFHGLARGEKGEDPIGAFDGYEPLLAEIVRFFQTGVAPVRPEETIEIFAYMAAADESKRRNGAPVNLATPHLATAGASDDPYQWLEEVTSERALNWVRSQNAVSTNELQSSPEFEPIRKRLLSILDSKDRIPYVTKHGPWYYNFWRDDKNVRGLWRRTTLEEFKKLSPAWETVLDLDKLGAEEKENWVWKEYDILYPTYDRCLVFLSRGGADAIVVREFDLTAKEFVKAGFYLPEAKTGVAWRNRDTLYVGTDFGPGSLTDSGYPRVVKEWKRGTPLADAKLVFEGKRDDVAVDSAVIHDHGRTYEFIRRGMTFFTSEDYLRQGDRWVKIEKPDDASVSTFEDQLLLRLRLDWNVNGTTYPAGTLLAASLDKYLQGDRRFEMLFTPTERTSLAGQSPTKQHLLLNELDNVRNRLYVLQHKDGRWTRTPLKAPGFGSVSIHGIDPDESDDYFMTITDFLTPSSLYFGALGGADPEKLKALPAFFNANGLEITQHEAGSKDGTKVPYFQVSRKGMALDAINPTLLYGYGGFEIPMLPVYNAGVGAAWLERGGVYVLANIRGGGEFGPRWHEAARKAHRQRAYDDFIAVAEDLVARKVTSPAHLGIQGGSNGGLLMGVMLTQRPDLFKAVVCQVPLLDMRRYNKLLAGASWMDEYGNPDKPEEWEYISKYSPYQNVSKDKHYSRVLFTTSTRDDRVHPGHARKMVARMKEQGHDLLYYENIEGGHGGAANNQQAAYMSALAYTFLIKELMPNSPAQ